MAILIGTDISRLAGRLVADDHRVRLIEKDAGVIDALDSPEVRNESRVRPQNSVEGEVNDQIGPAIQTPLIIDVKSVCHVVRKLVVAGAVVRILKALHTHAHY